MKNRFTDEQIIGFLREAEAGLAVAELCRRRKLPHQVDNSKLEIPVLNVLGMNSMGVLSPRESWGLNSL